MEDFDIFTDEIDYTKTFYNNTLKKYVYDIPTTPNAPNYQSGRKLMALESLASGDEAGCAFHLSEAMAPFLRTMAIYRNEQLNNTGDNLQKIKNFLKPVQDIINSNPKSEEKDPFNFLSDDIDDVTESLKQCEVNEEPFHKRYLRFSPENNVDNFNKILAELPKEWTVVQISAPYNPNENLKLQMEYRCEMPSIFITLLTNDYLNNGPITVEVPANVTKEGERPMFVELYSILDDNYDTIKNAHYLNNKRLIQNYWSRREDVDLRMKSVVNVMDKRWLGGWGGLLSGKLRDRKLRDMVVKLVDDTIVDWGFIKITNKQKILLYNLIESCSNMSSYQIKSCIRSILTQYGDIEDIRTHLGECSDCNKNFTFSNELCLKCLSKYCEAMHHFTLVDMIKAFSKAALEVKNNDLYAGLKEAKRQPVILIVDEALDSFPWESLPTLNSQPVSRIENLHFLHYLYRLHEPRVRHGYFNAYTDVGRYVINPEKDLDRMEKRMGSFVQYWCKFEGTIGEPPSPEEFLQYLTEADIYLYCGHGDGCHMGSGARGGVEAAAGARAVAVLSGCGSARLEQPPGRAPPFAAHRRLHIAGSPQVIGMLWEVTDLEVDKMVSSLIALYVPSAAPVPWPSVGKAAWSKGILDTNVSDIAEFSPCPDLLLAVSRARSSTAYTMIAGSVVARGLPVLAVGGTPR